MLHHTISRHVEARSEDEKTLPAPSKDNQRSCALTEPELPCQLGKGYKERFEFFFCTGDGSDAADCWKVVGGFACGF